MIISFVGTDGSGKSTAVKHLTQALRDGGTEVQVLDKWDIYDFEQHPECRFLQSPLTLLRKCISEMPGTSRAMFIFWSIYISMSKVDFNDGRVYVLDGYWMKHFATETLFGVDTDWIKATAAQLPQPDLTIFLHVPPEEAYKRKEAVNDFVPYEFGLDPEMKKDNFLTHQAKVLGVMEDWAQQFQWVTLDGTQPTQTVHTDILDTVKRDPAFPQFQPGGKDV